MRKNIFQAIYTLLMGLFIYSCSEFPLPDQVGVKGTVKLPIRVGAADLNKTLRTRIKNAFDAGEQKGTVYNVDYPGQTVQKFCISIPIKMTEELNPDNFLKTIDRQINKDPDGNPAPKKIDFSMKYPSEGHIPIDQIKLFKDGDDKISPVSLKNIAGYVRTITFGVCKEDIDSGIGLNFHFDTIPEGLEMILTCEEIITLNSHPKPPGPLFITTKPLKEGDNKFGNEASSITLQVNEYQNDLITLNFTMKLQAADHNHLNDWDLSSSGLSDGDDVIIKGEMSVFRVWEEARIDLEKALKASGTDDNVFGRFPATAFDLSRLSKYIKGGFEFEGLEVKIYMDGPDPKSINDLEAELELNARYNGNEDELYQGALSINQEPIKPAKYLGEYENKKEDEEDRYYYKYPHLPLLDNESGFDGVIDEDIIAKIFIAMPADLSFVFRIIARNEFVVTPETFHDADDSESSIVTTMLVMLPMSLKATGDGDKWSAIYLPDMFGEGDDLFGRKEPKELFNKGEIGHIRMTVDFSGSIITDGCLFINEEKELFSQGIRLSGKKTVFDFTDEQIKKIGEKMIIPDIKIEIDNEGTINVPKDMAIVSIKFEMKGLINVGDL